MSTKPDRKKAIAKQRAVREAVRLAPRICESCGLQHVTKDGHQACIRHIDRGKGRGCAKAPMMGQTLCSHHGGRTSVRKAAGQRKVAEARLAMTVRKLIPDADERESITNPLEKLLELAGEADAFRESLRMLANKLNNRIRYGAHAGAGEQIRAEVAMYRQALKDTTDMLVAIAKLDIEGRLARVEEIRLERVMGALNAGMTAANLDDEQKRSVMAGVGRHLHAVAS